jgi:rhodanese-related sulfurtransferase
MNTLHVQELLAFLESHAAQPPVLLDVREAWEVALADIQVPGTHTAHIPMGQVPARWAELPASQPIVCYCHHGMRSAQVVAFLVRQGLADVYNLTGGIDAWSGLVAPEVPRY